MGVVKSITVLSGLVQSGTGGDVANSDLDAALQASVAAIAGKLTAASNLSDLANAATARTNLGLGTAATANTGDFAAAVHTHTASQVTDFAEAVDDRVAALLVAGANITLTYNDVANTLTVAASGGGGSTIHTATVDFGSQPVGVKRFSFAHVGALTSQKVIAQALPTSSDADEYEWEPLVAQGYVSANGTVDVIVSATNPGGLVSGTRTVGYQLA